MGATPVSGGAALLIDWVTRDGSSVVALTDALGAVKSPAYRLDGTASSFGIAAQGTDVFVAAALEDGRGAFRVMDTGTGAPLGPWVCADDSAPRSNFYARVAGDREGAGWAVLARAKNGATIYRIVDRTGQGPK